MSKAIAPRKKNQTLQLRPGALFPDHIGFESLWETFMSGDERSKHHQYPPHSIVSLDDNLYRIDVAVAGFSLDELSVKVADDTLTIEGAQEESSQVVEEFLYKGISTKSFIKRFTLADHVCVIGSKLSNGILSITLERVVPEDKQSMLIDIEKGD